MHAIRGRFDGEKVIVTEAASGLLPGEVIVVFADAGDDATDRETWAKGQEAAFATVWMNDADALYDNL